MAKRSGTWEETSSSSAGGALLPAVLLVALGVAGWVYVEVQQALTARAEAAVAEAAAQARILEAQARIAEANVAVDPGFAPYLLGGAYALAAIAAAAVLWWATRGVWHAYRALPTPPPGPRPVGAGETVDVIDVTPTKQPAAALSDATVGAELPVPSEIAARRRLERARR